MATSGTTSTTIITVQDLIDDSARRAGKLAEELTVEQVQSAKNALYYLLSSLPNWGINYWKINRYIQGLQPDQGKYFMPLGCIDVLETNYRTVQRLTNGGYSTTGNGSNAFDGNTDTICYCDNNTSSIGINLGVPAQNYNDVPYYNTAASSYMGSIGILPGVTGLVNSKIEWSNDNITWNLLTEVPNSGWVDNQWQWFDITYGENAVMFRLTQTSGVNMALRELVFGSNPTAIPMSRMNRTDYFNLPNRQFTSNYPLQFWFDRTIPLPSMNVWPVPNNPFPQMEIVYHSYIEDVGALDGEIEIPQYFYMAIVWGLTHQVAAIMPQIDPARIQYAEAQYEKHLRLAQDENRDKSPIFWAPNISYYTS